MKLSKIKLKWQIFGFILGFAVIVIMLFCVFQIFMLERMYKKTKIDNIEELLTTVENKIYETVDLTDKQIINEFNKIATDAEVAIYLYNSDGTESLIINNGPYYKEFSNISMFEEISKKANVINKYSKFYITFENEVPAPNNMDYPALTKSPIDSVDSSIICAKYITINRVDYLLVLDARLAPVDPAVSTLKVQLIYISIIVLVLTICLALLIGHIISKPIININQSAKKLADGKRDIVFEGKGYEEIEELNNTLNYAVEELNKTEQLQKELGKEIKKLNNEITTITKKAIKESAEYGTSIQLNFFNEISNKYSLDIEDSMFKMCTSIHTDVIAEILDGKIYKDRAGISERIWADTKRFNKDIDVIISEGIAQKKGTYEIAKDLEKYVNPNEKQPIYNGVRGQANYNTYRLAHTSVIHAYQQAAKRSASKNPYVEGIKWISAHDKKCCEICKERDGNIYNPKDMPLDHPMGRCTFTYEIPMELDEIGKELSDWIKGSKNEKLDKWFSEYGLDFV